MSNPMFSVICATLLRGSYPRLVGSVRRQGVHDWEFIARADPGNEYIARNRAAKQARGEWLVFVDDDSVLRSDHLSRLSRDIRGAPETVAVTGPLQGNMWGSGTVLVDQPGWWIGANMAVRREVFLERPFEEDWGLGRIPRGWRADTDLGWSIEDRYFGRYLHDHELIVDHPGQMGSVWQPDVEDVFVRRWKARVMKRFLAVDPRLQQFLLQTQDLTADERAKVISARAVSRRSIPGLPVLEAERTA